MTGFDRFESAVLDAMQALMAPLIKAHKDDPGVGDAVYNHIFDLGPPAKDFKRVRTAREAYVVAIFSGVVEISKSLETLDDIAFLVSRFPYRNTRISPERYLQFHVEAYFGEVYILKERLSRYLVRIEREFKGDERLAEIRDSRRRLTRLLNSFLLPFVKARDSHVHVERLEDEGIARLGTINLLTRGSDDKMTSVMKVLYRTEYPKVRKKWKKNISQYNAAVRRLLNVYSNALWAELFEESSGKLRLPTRLLS